MTRNRVFLISSVLLCIGSLGLLAQEKYTASGNEEIYGTWTNEKNMASFSHPPKIVVSQNTVEIYVDLTSKLPPDKVIWSIVKKWTDSGGNIWYQANGTGTGGAQGYKWQELYKLSKNGTIMERALAGLPFGSDFDPSQSDYVGYTMWHRASD